MRKAAALLLTCVAMCACGESITAPTAVGVVTVVSLSPTSARIGGQVTITGTAFTAGANTVSFGAESVTEGDLPNEPTVIPDQPSADGRTITFTVPDQWRPACSYRPQGPCPFANIRTAPGIYRISVSNANGTSGDIRLTVTR
jgi:hypothetical protein